MNIKKFLKPNWRKIVITVILMIIPFIYLGVSSFIIHSCPVGMTDCSPYIFDLEFFSVMIFISIIITYLISCLIIWVYDKVKKK